MSSFIVSQEEKKKCILYIYSKLMSNVNVRHVSFETERHSTFCVQHDDMMVLHCNMVCMHLAP